MAVEADQPVVALEEAWEQEDDQGHEGPLVVAEEDEAGDGGDLDTLFHHRENDVEQQHTPFHAAGQLLVNTSGFTFYHTFPVSFKKSTTCLKFRYLVLKNTLLL